MQLLPDPPEIGEGPELSWESAWFATRRSPVRSRLAPPARCLPPRRAARVMTRAHEEPQQRRRNRRCSTDSNMCWRDRATRRVISGDADERIVCSLTIRKSFCFDAKFSSEMILDFKKSSSSIENVAFA